MNVVTQATTDSLRHRHQQAIQECFTSKGMHVVFKRKEALKWWEFSTYRTTVKSLEQGYRRALNRQENPRTVTMQRNSKVIGMGSRKWERHQTIFIVTHSIKCKQLLDLLNNRETREREGPLLCLTRPEGPSSDSLSEENGKWAQAGLAGRSGGFPEVNTFLW